MASWSFVRSSIALLLFLYISSSSGRFLGNRHHKKNVYTAVVDSPRVSDELTPTRTENRERTGYISIYKAPPTLLSVTNSEPVVLECQFNGTPSPMTVWLKNGELVQRHNTELEALETDEEETNQVEFSNKPSFSPERVAVKTRLYLDCVTPHDQGVYSCVGIAGQNKKAASTVLTVEDNAIVSEHCPNSKKTGDTSAFIVSWTSTYVNELGEDARLLCKAEGNPRPNVYWVKDDFTPLEDSSKFEISSNGDLLIRGLQWRDMGKYVCVAENSHGRDVVSTFVYPMQKSSSRRHSSPRRKLFSSQPAIDHEPSVVQLS